jgi:hypothetical protein
MSRDGASNPTAFRGTGFPGWAGASAAVAEEAQAVVRLQAAAAAETAAVTLLWAESLDGSGRLKRRASGAPGAAEGNS